MGNQKSTFNLDEKTMFEITNLKEQDIILPLSDIQVVTTTNAMTNELKEEIKLSMHNAIMQAVQGEPCQCNFCKISNFLQTNSLKKELKRNRKKRNRRKKKKGKGRKK
jgi:hypothetical protein